MNASNKIKLIGITVLFTINIAASQTTLHKTISSGHMSDVIATLDGNYLTAINNKGIGGIELIKFNSTGDTLWTKTFTDPSDNPIIRQIIQTADSGFAACGFLQGNFFLFLMKTDKYGNLSFYKQFDDTVVGTYQNVSIAETLNGNLVISGGASNVITYDDGFIIYTDNTGYILWSNKYGTSSDYEDVSRLIITHDDFYLMSGSAGSHVMLSKTDLQGNILWWKQYNPIFGNGYDIKETMDNGYIIAGNSGNSIIAIKTDSSGTASWCKGYSKNSVSLQAVSIAPTQDSGFVILSSAGSPVNDIFLVKTNSIGDTLWTHAYGTDSIDAAHFGYFYSGSILETNSGDLLFSGETKLSSNQFLSAIIRTDANGNPCDNYRKAGLDSVYNINVTVSNAVISSWGNFDNIIPSALIMTSTNYSPIITDLCLGTGNENTMANDQDIFIYPDPSDGNFCINIPREQGDDFNYLTVNNDLGEQIMKKELTKGLNYIKITAASSGIYFYTVFAKNKIVQRGKIIITK